MSNLKQHLPCFMFMFFINFFIKLFFLNVARVTSSKFMFCPNYGSRKLLTQQHRCFHRFLCDL